MVAQPHCSIPKAGAIADYCQPPGCGLHPFKSLPPGLLGARYPGVRLQAPIQTIVPSTLRDEADRQSLQLRAVVYRCLLLRRLSLSRLLCKATMDGCMDGGAPSSPVSGCSQAGYPDVWFICAPLEHRAAHMQPQQQCVAGTVCAPCRMASGFSHGAKGASQP